MIHSASARQPLPTLSNSRKIMPVSVAIVAMDACYLSHSGQVSMCRELGLKSCYESSQLVSFEETRKGNILSLKSSVTNISLWSGNLGGL